MRRNRIVVNCAICNNDIEMIPSRVKKTKRFACSKECLSVLRSKDKVPKQCVVCGKIFPVYLSMKDRFSTCSKQCQRDNRSADKNANWKDGRTLSNPRLRYGLMQRLEYKDWRKSVFERDDYICQFCGKRGGNLEADHIKPWSLFPTLRYDLSNGRTLCRPCHITTFKDVAKCEREL